MDSRIAAQVLFLSLGAAVSIAQPVADERTPAATTEAAASKLMSSEADMKRTLDELTQRAEGKREALVKLRKAQDAWERYREAQLDAVWPFPPHGGFGTVYPMCVAAIKTALTEARTRELRAMLKPPEGDACNSQWPE